MKSRRRHELKQNVLDAELGKVVEFFRRRGTYVAWGVLGLALIALIVWYVYRRHHGRLAAIQTDYDNLVWSQNDPDSEARVLSGLQSLADQGKDKWIAADACVRVGDIFARQALAAKRQPDRQELMEKAARYYRKAIDEFPDYSLARGKAHFGLAKLAESRGDFAAASESYHAVAEVTKLRAYPIIGFAMDGLNRLPKFEVPVPMATTMPSTQPASAAATQPAIAPAQQEIAPRARTES